LLKHDLDQVDRYLNSDDSVKDTFEKLSKKQHLEMKQVVKRIVHLDVFGLAVERDLLSAAKSDVACDVFTAAVTKHLNLYHGSCRVAYIYELIRKGR